MTVPWLMNCPHQGNGWCLDCAKKLGQENWNLQDELTRLRTENERLLAALTEVLGWYDRDGSVGGCDQLIEDVVRPLFAKLLGRE